MLIIKKCSLILVMMIPLFGGVSDSTIIKNPKKAFFASIIPGGGQIYNGRIIKGFTIMGLEIMGIQSWLENSKIYSNYDSGDYLLRKNRYLEKRNKYAWWVIVL